MIKKLKEKFSKNAQQQKPEELKQNDAPIPEIPTEEEEKQNRERSIQSRLLRCVSGTTKIPLCSPANIEVNEDKDQVEIAVGLVNLVVMFCEGDEKITLKDGHKFNDMPKLQRALENEAQEIFPNKKVTINVTTPETRAKQELGQAPALA